MPLPPDIVHRILSEKLPDAEINIENLAGDNDHYRIHVKSALFNGKSRLEQQRICLQAIKGTEIESIHALSWTTKESKM